MKKIGIIGSGIVARTLGDGFIKHGHEIMLGTRDPEKLEDWLNAKNSSKAHVGSINDCAAFGSLIVLAVKGTVALQVVTQINPEFLANKPVIDATNPIADQPPANGVLSFFTGLNDSLMEGLQKASPQAHFVKAFNSVGSSRMVNPDFQIRPTMFICGNQAKAKTEVSALIEQFGWEVEDMGSAEAARAIEPLCILWCIPGFTANQWTHAFKLLK